MKASEVLRDARELAWTNNGRYPCAGVALARQFSETPQPASNECFTYLGRAVGSRSSDIVDIYFDIFRWNDTEGRTKTDVLDAFDHAIKLALEAEALESEVSA